jgi:hypothetical protein
MKKKFFETTNLIIIDYIPLFYFDHKIHPSLSKIIDNSLFLDEIHTPNRLPVLLVEDIILT